MELLYFKQKSQINSLQAISSAKESRQICPPSPYLSQQQVRHCTYQLSGYTCKCRYWYNVGIDNKTSIKCATCGVKFCIIVGKQDRNCLLCEFINAQIDWSAIDPCFLALYFMRVPKVSYSSYIKLCRLNNYM